jgi:hypothetical protein
MSHRLSGLLLLALVSAMAPAAGAEDPPGLVTVSGRYRVSGETTDKATGAHRTISGTLSVQQEGGTYTASFELRTVQPGSEAAPAQVLGTGAGTVEGHTLRGTASTQLLVSAVPGVDAGFVGMPRQVSARIRSTSRAEIGADGTIEIEIDNDPAEGDAYRPTHTLLKGRREMIRQP